LTEYMSSRPSQYALSSEKAASTIAAVSNEAIRA
jgi:hypothetical protein